MNSGKTSKRKGKAGELEVARIFREHGYIDAKRSQQYCGADGDADIIGVPNLHIEVKRRKHLDIKGSVSQAESDCKEGLMPIVCYRGDRKPWVVVMNLEHFNRLSECSIADYIITGRTYERICIYDLLEEGKKESEKRNVLLSAVIVYNSNGDIALMYLEDFLEIYRDCDFESDFGEEHQELPEQIESQQIKEVV